MSVISKMPLRVAGFLSMLALAGCVSGAAAPRLTEAGGIKSGVYTLTAENMESVRQRALATVNNTRASAGVGPLVLHPSLQRAADRHAVDMAAQHRAWTFGSDGSTPVSRAAEADYTGRVIGELVSQTYETEVQAIATWAGDPEQRSILLSPQARHMGFGTNQTSQGMLWWVLTLGE